MICGECLDNCSAPCVLTSTDLDWQRHCDIRTNECSEVDDLLLGRLLHAGAIFRATEHTTQIVEGAEASTLVCQHLLGQGFPQALLCLRHRCVRADLLGRVLSDWCKDTPGSKMLDVEFRFGKDWADQVTWGNYCHGHIVPSRAHTSTCPNCDGLSTAVQVGPPRTREAWEGKALSGLLASPASHRQ